MRLRQEDPAPNAEPNMVDLTNPQTIKADIYYRSCDQIDRHNRCRQESLYTEKKMGTEYCSNRFNLSIFSMNVVNFWLEYQGITKTAEIQADFYNYLSEEIIDNTYYRFMIRRTEGRIRIIVNSDDDYVDDNNQLFDRINGNPRCRISLHATPTKNRRKKRDGKETQYLLQGKCKVFRKKTTHVCLECAETYAVRNEIWVCHPKTNRSCFSQNVHSTHELYWQIYYN